MASRQQIKRRIGSVRNTRQITKAMQLVAASKLRHAQEAVVRPREYAQLAREILTRLRQFAADENEFKLFTARPVKTRLVIAITSDLGLAGAYDGNVIRMLIREAQADRAKGVKTRVVAIGRKAAQSASHIAGLDVEAVYTKMPDKPTADELRPILSSVVGLFANGQIDQVDIIFTKFISSVSQQVQLQRLLPAGFEEVALNDELAHADIEPDAGSLLRAASLRLLEAQLYQGFLEAIASEQSMRMLAMKNATDNASDLIDDLTLVYNNARQAAITQELAEITGGAEAMK
ncbi:MAG TPA: ATP synthase F1 subunit gamma [Patescibacteria group bacterium]|nr:ATP synthase F1 subunit gamma [Patescibacteria group bacterium]HSW99427.1 ATP synthase F1 subunit gamma [Patescibacteria group bacterium]